MKNLTLFYKYNFFTTLRQNCTVETEQIIICIEFFLLQISYSFRSKKAQIQETDPWYLYGSGKIIWIRLNVHVSHIQIRYIYSHNSVMKTCTCGVVKTCCFYNLRLDKLINLESIRIIFYKHLILKEQKNYLRLMSVSKWVSIFKNKFHFLQMSYSSLQLSFPSLQMRFLLYSWVSLLHKCVFYFTQCVSYFTIKFPFFTNAFPSLQVSILSYKCVSF